MENLNIFGKISRKEFEIKFSTKEDCLRWISEKKWENGFVCRKCGHQNYWEDKNQYTRKCTKCKHLESATSHTLFHKCKIPLPDAFKIIYEICLEPKLSSRSLSEKLNLRNMTCWGLKSKLKKCSEQGGCDAVFGKKI